MSTPAVLGVTFCSPQLHCCCSLDCRPPLPSIRRSPMRFLLPVSECATTTDHCCIWRSDWHGIVRCCGRYVGRKILLSPLVAAAVAAAAPPSPALCTFVNWEFSLPLSFIPRRERDCLTRRRSVLQSNSNPTRTRRAYARSKHSSSRNRSSQPQPACHRLPPPPPPSEIQSPDRDPSGVAAAPPTP